MFEHSDVYVICILYCGGNSALRKSKHPNVELLALQVTRYCRVLDPLEYSNE